MCPPSRPSGAIAAAHRSVGARACAAVRILRIFRIIRIFVSCRSIPTSPAPALEMLGAFDFLFGLTAADGLAVCLLAALVLREFANQRQIAGVRNRLSSAEEARRFLV